MIKSTLLAIALALSPLAAFASPVALPTFTEQALKPSGQLNGNCSATVIYSDRDKISGEVTTIALTAAHCTAKTMDRVNEITFPRYDKQNRQVGKDSYKAKVLGKWYKGDLSLLQFVDKEKVFPYVASIAPADTVVAMGTDVYTVGYPAGMALSFTEGVFGARESFNFPSATTDTEYYRATPPIMGGNSGGALFLFNGDKYELIGVSDLVLGGNPQMGWYVPVDQIIEYLKVAVPQSIDTPK